VTRIPIRSILLPVCKPPLWRALRRSPREDSPSLSRAINHTIGLCPSRRVSSGEINPSRRDSARQVCSWPVRYTRGLHWHFPGRLAILESEPESLTTDSFPEAGPSPGSAEDTGIVKSVG